MASWFPGRSTPLVAAIEFSPRLVDCTSGDKIDYSLAACSMRCNVTDKTSEMCGGGDGRAAATNFRQVGLRAFKLSLWKLALLVASDRHVPRILIEKADT